MNNLKIKCEKLKDTNFDPFKWQEMPLDKKKELVIQLNKIRCHIFGSGSIFMETPLEFLKLVEEWIPFGKNKRAIDIGCGSGKLEKILLDCGYTVERFDISFLQAQRAKISSLSKIKTRFSVGDLIFMPYKKNAFEKAIALFVLEHILDVSKALKEINRILKPKGTAFIAIPISTEHKSTFNLISGHVSSFTLSNINLKRNENKNIYYLDKDLANSGLKIEKRLLFHAKGGVKKSFRYAKNVEEAEVALYICLKQ